MCVLSGRSEKKVQKIAHRLSLPWCAFKLTEPLLDHYLKDVDVVLNMVAELIVVVAKANRY